MPTLYDNFSQVRQYIDENNTSYVTKTELANASYATTSQLPVIDENLIPKETATYTLGDSSHLYSATYSSQVNVGNNSKMYNDSGGITFSINSNNGIRIDTSAIYPKTSKAFNNGSSSNKWATTYTSNLYADRSYIGDINVFYNTPGGGMILQRNGTDVCAFLGGGNIGISPPSNKSASLGNPLQYWNKIYADTAYLQNTSYSSSIVPKENNTYTLGNSSYMYDATYTNRVNFGSNKVYIYNNGDTQMKFGVNGSDRFRIDYNKFMPSISNVETQLGTSNNPFTTTYTNNLYLNSTDIFSIFQRKPVVVWEASDPSQGLTSINANMSASPAWQLTNLDMSPYKRVKIYTKAAQKTGTTASASTTPAMILEMSLDSRATISEYGGHYLASTVIQKSNDNNRLATLTCAISSDKTSFVVLRMTNLYGTAATDNADVGGYVFLIEGWYD